MTDVFYFLWWQIKSHYSRTKVSSPEMYVCVLSVCERRVPSIPSLAPGPCLSSWVWPRKNLDPNSQINKSLIAMTAKAHSRGGQAGRPRDSNCTRGWSGLSFFFMPARVWIIARWSLTRVATNHPRSPPAIGTGSFWPYMVLLWAVMEPSPCKRRVRSKPLCKCVIVKL